MVRKRAEEKRHREMHELGEQNAALIPRVKRWCEHLQVEMVSAGLLAEITGLPIGRMAINCAHAKGVTIQAMQLDQVAACFITENCRGCPHHQEVDQNNVGREILREADLIQQEERNPDPIASEASRRLKGLVTGDLSQALVNAPTTEQSVLECVARLETPGQAEETAKLLCQAAELAPEFFSDLACEVIAEHFPDLSHGGFCAEALRLLGRKRGAIPPVAIRAALHCAEDEFCHDSALDLLADYYNGGGKLPSLPTVTKMIRHHDYREVGMISHEPEANPAQIRVLLAIGRRDLSCLTNGLNRTLVEPLPQIRIAGPVAVTALLPELPELGPAVLDLLIRSLELDDNPGYGTSVDIHACDAIGEIFTYYPKETRFRLDMAGTVVSEEAKVLLMKVYERLNREASPKESGPQHERALAALPDAVDALISALMDVSRILPVREVAAETLSRIAWNHPSLLIARMDALLGALAIVVNEHVKFEENNPGRDPDIPWLPPEEKIQYEHVATEIFSALEKLASLDARKVLESTVQMIESLNSNNPAQERLKWHLVGLFQHISDDYTVGPQVVPPLYNALMDFDSVMVRARALSVIEHILGRAAELVPDNMREMVIIYLREDYNAIHQQAAKAMRYFKPETPEQAKEILKSLVAQYSVYSNEREDHPHLRELMYAAARICRSAPAFFETCALPMLVKQARSKVDQTARDALEEWKRSAPASPTMARLYVAETLAHLRRCPPGHNDWHPYDPAHRIFLTLFACDPADITANLDGFQSSIATLAVPVPFQALQLLSVLLHHEQYGAVVNAADAILKALPQGAQKDQLRNQALLTKAAAQAEIQVASGRPQDAIAILTSEEPRLKVYVPDQDRDEPEAIVRSLSLAHKVAERMRKI